MKIGILIFGLLITLAPLQVKADMDGTVKKLFSLAAAVSTFIIYKYDLAESHVVELSKLMKKEGIISRPLESTKIFGSRGFASWFGNSNAQNDTQACTQIYKVGISTLAFIGTYLILK